MATYTVELTEGTTEKAFLAFMKALEISFKKSKAQKEEKPYNPAFVQMMERSIQDIQEGKGVTVTLDDIWK